MSQLSFDAELLPRLEALYRTSDILRRRRLVRDALDARPGQRILDVGCGPGFYDSELVEDVGTSGVVVGVDRSLQMLDAARRRNHAHANVSFVEGEATALPVEDKSFDAALCVQVLEYVPDTIGALREMYRALRPGGRVVVWDVDWSTLSIHSSDASRSARVLEAWDRHLAHPALPPTLAAQLRSAGFQDVEAEGHAFTASELGPETYLGSVVTLIEEYVASRDDVPEEDVRGWSSDLRALGERGESFFAVVQFCFSATRAAA